jgi:PKD repeat protein
MLGAKRVPDLECNTYGREGKKMKYPSTVLYSILLFIVGMAVQASSQTSPPTNLTANVSDGQVNLAWEAPDVSAGPDTILLAYDDGESETGLTTTTDNIELAVRFTPPAYPSKVLAVLFLGGQSMPDSYGLLVYRDVSGSNDGPSGTPALSGTVAITSSGTNGAVFPDPVTVSSGDFYVSLKNLPATNNYLIGLDTSSPDQGRSWLKLGSTVAPLTGSQFEGNLVIQAIVEVPAGSGETAQIIVEANSDDMQPSFGFDKSNLLALVSQTFYEPKRVKGSHLDIYQLYRSATSVFGVGAVQNYRIYRSTQSPVQTNSSNRIAQVSGTTLTYTDLNPLSGTSHYVVTARYEEGESGPSNEVSVVPPDADFTASPTSGAAPLEVDFTDQSTGNITSRTWDFGDGETSTQQNPTHNYEETGVYTVELTVSGPNGSDIRTRSNYIEVEASPPLADFTASPTSGTAPLIVSFTDESTGNITSRTWDFGDGETSTQMNPQHTYEDPGMYTVTLTARGPDGEDSETKQNLIEVERGELDLPTPTNLTANAATGRIELDWEPPVVQGPTVQESEPNNSLAQADVFKLGDTAQGLISPAGDGDLWRFQGTSGQRITIDVDARDNGSLLDPVIGLVINRDSDGDGLADIIAENDDFGGSLDSRIDATLPATETYFVLIVDYSLLDDSIPDRGGPNYFYDLKLLPGSTQTSQVTASQFSAKAAGYDVETVRRKLVLTLSEPVGEMMNWQGTGALTQIENDIQTTLQGYNIYRSTSTPVLAEASNRIGNVNASTTEFEDAVVASGITYHYVVTAVYDDGESEPSNETFAVAVSVQPPVLLTPSDNVTDVAINPRLQWRPSEGATSYQVNVSTSADFNTLIVDASNLTQTSLSLSDLQFGTRYFWRVRSFSANDTSNWSAVWRFTTIALPIPPTLVQPPNGASLMSNSTTLIWIPPQNAESYQLQVSKSSVFSSAEIDTAGITEPGFQLQNLENNTLYYWRVSTTNSVGTGNWSIVFRFTTAIVSVERIGDEQPAEFFLSQNYPNPFNPETTILYHVPNATQVRLTVYNMTGQRVVTLADGVQSPGVYSARWNGKDDFGREVASGLYLYRLQASDFGQLRRMLLIR